MCRHSCWLAAGICGSFTTKDLIPQIPVLPISYGDAEPILKGPFRFQLSQSPAFIFSHVGGLAHWCVIRKGRAL